MRTKVILEGALAKIVGHKELEFEIDSLKDVFSLLSVNFPKLKPWLIEHAKEYSVYKVQCKTERGAVYDADDSVLDMEQKLESVRIAPIFTGAGGNGVMQTIVGAIVTVIGIVMCFIPGMQGFAPSVICAGIGMMIGGIIAMLMAPSKNEDEENGDNKKSYFFNGAANTTRQGMPVPLVFGTCMAGSAVISASIDVYEDTSQLTGKVKRIGGGGDGGK